MIHDESRADGSRADGSGADGSGADGSGADESARGFRPAAAWGNPAISAPRWPASLAVVAALALWVTLPEKLTVGPRWVLPGFEAALLVPVSIAWPHRRHQEPTMARVLSLALIAIVNIANVASLVLLVHYLLVGGKTDGRQLVFSSVEIWLTNVAIFALWYWELDRGGPGQRCLAAHREPDFLFPQMSNPESGRPGWVPGFADYLYVSFTNATAFSPTDTLPLTVWAKMLMLVQSMASLITVALVAARAVNILS